MTDTLADLINDDDPMKEIPKQSGRIKARDVRFMLLGAVLLWSIIGAHKLYRMHHAFARQEQIDKVNRQYPQYRLERWYHYVMYSANCPTIPEVERVEVNKTSDTDQYVIHMMGKDHTTIYAGDACSLWLNGNDVDSYTDY